MLGNCELRALGVLKLQFKEIAAQWANLSEKTTENKT